MTANGVDPEHRMQITGTVSAFVELINGGHEIPPLRELADVFLDRDDGMGGEMSYEDHVGALSELVITAMVMLAEHKAQSHTDEGFEVHVLIRPPDAAPDHVTISVSGYNDVRCAIAALANLERDGYIDQLWNIEVKGKVNPYGPQVVFQHHSIGEKEKEA